MVAIAVRAVSKVFGDGATAVDRVDLDVASGEFLVLLGPSGCGKSTLLRLIGGLEEPTRGEVLLDGVPVTAIPPQERNVALVVQTFALYPHLTVAQNIGFPLRAAGGSATDVAARIAEMARHLGIADLLGRRPEHLSGGQRQRVALARALVRRPALLLLDEPLSNVDAGVRADLRGEITALARRIGVTTVYVTHDQNEALSMADRVAVLRRGVLQQVGPPAQVYADPRTLFVAAFLGTPPTSLLEAAVYAVNGRVVLDLGSQEIELPPGDPRTAALARRHTERVTVALRALRPATDEPVQLTGTVRAVLNRGPDVLAYLDTGGVPTPPQVVDFPAAGGRSPERTPYGFVPAYDPEVTGEPPPAGEVLVRIAAPGTVAVGARLTAGLDLGELLLFDRAGRRIGLDIIS
ncbi:multiple sugar transport system ATP-binding protein [Krasilnikovia cinnamomea]|uniref:Multiple sugar transport system ATP-binding protein n=1 Tax=Krasilnikovia cinnamomea TaxID=349313 RepID=A0A4Q7ZGT7_9ACTN|nr:ABC transporter ATP-binding protein [Krasilnikovia cinnamomea]RZU50012.1 multiple sugar transport system ATP-binding protein [Krasilnikovia cinnamomea]